MIKSEIKEIINVFNNNYIYEIPDFQRDFVWGEDEVRRLIKDFKEDTEDFKVEIKETDGYLLGNIVLIEDQHDVNKKIVIDGQQRLTTLSLLYKALELQLLIKMQEYKNPTEIKKWSQRSSDLASGYSIVNDEGDFETFKIQHHKSLEFGNSYKEIIQDDSNIITNQESSSDKKINEVFEILEEEISSLDDQQLTKFVTYIKTKVMLIVTTAPNLSKAFQLFEILNNRGKDLEPLDLIKNSLLKNLTSSGYNEFERDQFNNDWKQFVKNLEISSKRKVESSTFLKHYLVGTEGLNKNKDKLFEYFSNNEMNTKEVLDLVKNFKKVSRIYGDIEKQNYDSFIEDNSKMYILFDLLKLRQAHTMLIAFYDETMNTKEKVVDLAIRLGASVLYSYTQTNYIEAEIPSLLREYYKNKKTHEKDVAFTMFVNEVENRIKQKSKLAMEAVSTRKFENSKGQYNTKGLNLLKFLEIYAHNNVHIKNPTKDKKLTLEHILPRKFDSQLLEEAGFFNESEFKDYVNRIGNLAIIYNTDNSHLSNKKFNEKVKVYKTTDFLTTNSLAGELKTEIKAGKDSKLYGEINGMLVDNKVERDNLEFWNKDLIDNRSIKVGLYLEKILNKEG